MLPAGAVSLVEFNAGRVVIDGTTARPDTRRGRLRAIRTEDGLCHVQWLQRQLHDTIEMPEWDEIVFPDEATFEQTGPARVYILKFKEQSDRNVMFWMQEPAADGDDALCRRLNAAINTSLGADDEDLGAAVGGDEEVPEEMLPTDALLRGHVSLLQVRRVLWIWLSLLSWLHCSAAWLAVQVPQVLLLELAPPNPGASLAAALLAAMARQQQQQQGGGRQVVAAGPGLGDVLTSEVLAPLLADPQVLECLSSYLPEEQRSPAALRSLARSPHFRQQLETFSHALQTGQLDLQQFELQAQGFTVADFLRAIQDRVDREQQQQQQEGAGPSQ